MARQRSCFVRGVILLSSGYCLTSVLFVLIAPYLRRFWWLAIANDVGAPLVFLPVPLLLALALIWRSRTLGVAVAVAALAFALVFRSALLPVAPAVISGTPLRVMTYNQLFDNPQPEAVVETIRRQQADIVAIQELSPSVMAAVQRDLSASYPYQWLEPDDGASGLGLISRFPFAQQLDQPESRSQRATVQFGTQTLTVINVHPSVPFIYSGLHGTFGTLHDLQSYANSPRQQQLRTLLKTIDTLDGSLIVLGDFNTSDRDPLYSELASHLRDAYREGAWGFGKTFPSTFRIGPIFTPIIRIDYIWLSGALATHRAHVDCNSGGSDHCLLVADLVMQ